MNFSEWKRVIWPTLSADELAAILAEVRSLRADGWSLHEAWVLAACTSNRCNVALESNVLTFKEIAMGTFWVLTEEEIEHRRFLRSVVCSADRKLCEAREALASYERKIQEKRSALTA